MGKGDEKDKEKKSKDKSKDKVDKDKKADKIDKKSKDKADKAEKPDKSEKKADKKDDKKSKDKPKKKDEPKVVKALRKEYDAFIESDAETAQIEWKRVDAENAQIYFRFGDAEKWTVTYPEDYPNTTDRFFVFSEASSLSGVWCDNMMEYCEKSSTKKPPISLQELLVKAAQEYLDIEDAGMDGSDEENEDIDYDDDMDFQDETPKKAHKPSEDVAFDKSKYLDLGSPAATLRLLRDLKEVSDAAAHKLGFTATPAKDPNTGKENLYHWNIQLHDFEKDTQLYRDLSTYESKSGKKCIELEMRFSKDYPFSPPFVRVLRPRFKFLTGHVTVGGSICMELLTMTGWRSTNSIESILIQIRSEMVGGGAQLELGHNNDYSESEAWDAYYRAARNHGWDTTGLSAGAFPKLT